MKKLLLAATVLFALSFSAKAQPAEGISFGAGPRISLPVGDWSDFWSLGVGAEVQAEYGFSSKASAVFTTGYSSFLGKKISGTKIDNIGYIPILVGARYYAAPSFFVGAQVGYGLQTFDGDSEGAFNYQPQVGYNAEKFQVILNYNGLSKDGSTSSHIGLAAIFKFGGSK